VEPVADRHHDSGYGHGARDSTTEHGLTEALKTGPISPLSGRPLPDRAKPHCAFAETFRTWHVRRLPQQIHVPVSEWRSWCVLDQHDGH
jgi:hypothetical protein